MNVVPRGGHEFARFTGSGLVDGLNVVPHGGHEIAGFTGGAVVGVYSLPSPSRVACMPLDPLCPTSLHWLASLLPVTPSAILSIIKTTPTLTTLSSSSPSLYVMALGLRAHDSQMLVMRRRGAEPITSTRLDGNINNVGFVRNIRCADTVGCFNNAVPKISAFPPTGNAS